MSAISGRRLDEGPEAAVPYVRGVLLLRGAELRAIDHENAALLLPKLNARR